MITDEGKIYIKRYLAGYVPAIASTIAYGIGDRAESVVHKKLQFEIGRAEIVVTSYDFVTNQLIFKAPLPDDYEGKVYEVALFSQEINALAGDYGSKLLATFDSESEDWETAAGAAATFNSTNTRAGADSLRVSGTGTTSAVLDGLDIDLSENSSADKFAVAYFNSANVASVDVRLKTDASNYYNINLPGTAGYQFGIVTKGAATVTGTPTWSDIQTIEVRVNASGGTGTVDFDGLRIEDIDTPNPEYVMIAEERLTTPFVKTNGRIQAIEFALDVSI